MYEYQPFVKPNLQQDVKLAESPPGKMWSGRFVVPTPFSTGSFEAAETGGGTRAKRAVWISTDADGRDVIAEDDGPSPHVDLDKAGLTPGATYYCHQRVKVGAVSPGQSTETLIVLYMK